MTPRVLIVSHNVIGGNTGMGKTMASMLACIPPDHLAQLYLRPEVPTIPLCSTYYRVTDTDVMRSLFARRACGGEVQADSMELPMVSSGFESHAYLTGRKRRLGTYYVRNALWRTGRWMSPQLVRWLDDFSPDVVFFASGDYAFSYDIVYEISRYCRVPVVTWCCDDYYLTKRWPGNPLGALNQRILMRAVGRVASHSAQLVVITDEMARDYSSIFRCPATVVRISASANPYAKPFEERSGMVYLGSVGVGRAEVLMAIGEGLAAGTVPGLDEVDVYTGERDQAIRERLGKSAGISLHNPVDADEMLRLLGSARYALHVESARPEYVNRTRYSLSTKIGDLLQSGACIVACGPADIASMSYFERGDAALVAHSPHDAVNVIRETGDNRETYSRLVENALTLARKNHDKAKNDEVMERVLGEAAKAVVGCDCSR